MNGSGWRVTWEAGELTMTVNRWTLCRRCMRGHITTEHNGRFVRVVNMDQTPVWHRP